MIEETQEQSQGTQAGKEEEKDRMSC